MLPNYQKQAKTKLVASVISLIVIASVIIVINHIKVKTVSPSTPIATTSTAQTSTSTPTTTAPNTSSQSSPTSTLTTTTTTTTASSAYADGTYTASSDYYVPHGDETIQVTLTLSNGTITNASIVNSEGDPTSASYQEGFASEYKSYVVGKSIAGLQLSRISGASDTTQGFDDALNQIAAKAKA
jgi:uncharacterized protein with FMN-binding domain